MMHLDLVRDVAGGKSTGGKLYVDGEFACYTLENPWLDNKRRISSVPEGTYDIKFRRVGRWIHKARGLFPDMHNAVMGMLELQDVPGRDYILIHWGNYPTDTQGCILVGNGRGVDAVWRSQDAYQQIYPPIAKALSCGQRVTLEIKGAPIA